MRRKLIVALGLLLLGGSIASCDEDAPTAVGGELIDRGLRTFEVVLDAGTFLQADSTYDNIGALHQVQLRAVARDFEGALDAHILFGVRRPLTVSYDPDGDEQSQVDSIVAFRNATVTLIVDTTTVEGPVAVEVLTLAESWDRTTTSWELRFDTAGVAESWTTPGGTTGTLVGGDTIRPGEDTVRIAIDSASAAIWADTAAARRGGLIRAATSGTRVMIRSVQFEFGAIPEETTDTTVPAGGASRSITILTPEADTPPTAEVRVGGLPLWRTLFRFQPLENLVLDCSDGGAACTVPISDVSVNLATLLLEPVPGGAHRLEVPIRLQGRAVLEADGVPLVRSPMSGPLGVMQDSVPVALFTDPAGIEGPVSVPVTEYVRRLADPGDADPPLWLAILAQGEGQSLGYASFASVDSADPPRLRLVVSIPNEELFR